MKKILHCLFIIISLISHAFAQAPSILINGDAMPRQACVDALFRLPVTVSGRFNAGNQFKVQVRYPYATEVVSELPATLVGSFLEFTFKDARLYETPNVQLRIMASAPKTEGFWFDQAFSVYTKGTVGLTQVEYSDTLNLYDDYAFRLTGQNTSIAWATLYDSSRIQLPSNGNFNVLQQIVISREGPFTIAHAENECGAMAISSSLRPVVNKTSIKTLTVHPQQLCAGAEVKVGFSVAGPALPAQTRYRIRFSDTNPDGARPNAVDVPAQLQDGYLVARFPEQFNVPFNQYFVAQVVTDNAVGSKSARFSVAPKPTAVFNTKNETINFGESWFVSVNANGLPPLSVQLSDGTTTNLGEQGQLLAIVRPLQTTSYTIKSMSSGCTNAASLGTGVLEIKVNPGIGFANQKDRQVFCAGSKASVKFMSNAALTAGTQFWIQAKSLTNTADKILIPAIRSGDQLVFEAPQRAQGYAEFAYQIITANPALESAQMQLIEIQTIPGMDYHASNTYDYQIPTNVQVNLMLHGGAPYVVETAEGARFNFVSDVGQYEFYLQQNREFRFKSISNGCFKNENLPAKSFRVLGNGSNPAIAFEPFSKLVCANDSIEVTFKPVGNFNAGNQFQIQAMTDCCEFKTLATVSKGGKYKVKMAADRYSLAAQVRIASTSPALFSQLQEFNAQLPPEKFRLSKQGTAEEPAQVFPHETNLTLDVDAERGLPTRIDYSWNGKDTSFINTSSQGTSIPISPVPGKVNAFVIKSATNVCGTVPVNLTAYIYPVYRIAQPMAGDGRFCLGGPISIPFWVVDKITTSPTFALQVAREGSDEFVTVANAESGRLLTGKIPDNVVPGNYKMRIRSSDGMVSNVENIRIGTIPTSRIGNGGESEPILVDPGQRTSIKITLTGSPDWTVVYDDNSKAIYTNPEETRQFSPVRSGNVFVKSVSNFCGYGTSSGSQPVKVRPGLQVNATTFNACEGGIFPVNYSLLGDADLSDDYLRFELINLSTQVTLPLDSTRTLSGTRALKIPEPMPAGPFAIRVSVRKYNLSTTLSTIIIPKPGAILTGNTVINNGETTYIVAQITRDLPEGADVLLSDGTPGRITGMAGEQSYLQVSPKQTTTYTIASLKNGCGAGATSGSAIVEVNPVSERSITTPNVSGQPGVGTCAGNEITVFYTTKGTFTPGNKMTVQISDSTGRNFTNIQTTGTASPLKAIIPQNLPDGRLYRIRVAASDAGVASGAFNEAFVVTQKSKARFSTSSVNFDGVNAPRVKVLLEGKAPWTFYYGIESASIQKVTTSNPVHEIELRNAALNQVYQILSVSTACGIGDTISPASVRVEVITGNEPSLRNHVRIFPNPAQDMLVLAFSSPARRKIEVFNMAGNRVKKVAGSAQEERVDISQLPAGVYIVEVSEGAKTASYRLVKQ